MSSSRALRLLRTVRAFVSRDVAITTSYRFDVVLQCIAASVLVAVLYFVAMMVRSEGSLGEFGGYFPFAVVGLAAACIVDSAYASFAGALRGEQVAGTLEELLLSPARPIELLIGASTFNLARAVATAILYVGAASVVHGWFLRGNVLLVAAILALGAAASACLGIVSASFVVVFKKGDPLQFLLRGAGFLLGGVLFLPSTLPAPLRAVSRLLPITWTLDAVRAVLLKGAALQDVRDTLELLAAFVVVAAPASLYCLRLAVRRAMRDGSLSQS